MASSRPKKARRPRVFSKDEAASNGTPAPTVAFTLATRSHIRRSSSACVVRADPQTARLCVPHMCGLPRCLRSAACAAGMSLSLLLGGARSLALSGAVPSGQSWPFVANMGDRCSGVLVHPNYILSAGHCAQRDPGVLFGPPISASLPVRRCTPHPEASPGTAFDISVCELEHPVHVAVATLLSPEAASRVQVGTPVVLVGYGGTPTGGPGTKREAWSQVIEIGDVAILDGSRAGVCPGDSGGPALVPLSGTATSSESEWGVFAVASATKSAACGGGADGYFVMLHHLSAWIEGVVAGADGDETRDGKATGQPAILSRATADECSCPGNDHVR